MTIEFQAIDVMHTQIKNPEGSPIRLAGTARVKGKVEAFEQYPFRAKDLDSAN